MDKKKNDEKDLALRLRQGDESAMKQVFEAYYWRLHYFSFKMTGDMADAEDIVQEAFLNFWINIRDKDILPENIQAYLYRMVRNRCVSYLERQQMINGRKEEVTEQFYNRCQRQMDEIALQEELFRRISNDFSSLTPVQIQVMELLYLEGLSVAEAAAQLNTTVNNIRNHKARAVERLKAIVKAETLLFVVAVMLLSLL